MPTLHKTTTSPIPLPTFHHMCSAVLMLFPCTCSSLFVGSGPRGQNVFTWMPDTNHTRISQDLSPLLQYLWRHNLVSATAYVGTVAFGSESFHSTNPITFSAQNLSLTITGGEAPNLSFDSSPDTSCKSWSDRNMPGSLLVLVVWVAVVCSIW